MPTVGQNVLTIFVNITCSNGSGTWPVCEESMIMSQTMNMGGERKPDLLSTKSHQIH